MNRRDAMKIMAVSAAAATVPRLVSPLFAADIVEPASTRSSALAAYETLRFGCSFHFGLPTFTGDDYDVGAVPATTYAPKQLDVRQWISAAHQLGAKYCVRSEERRVGKGCRSRWRR